MNVKVPPLPHRRVCRQGWAICVNKNRPLYDPFTFLTPGGEVGRDISVYRDLRDGLDLDKEARRALEFVRAKLAG